MAGGLGAGLVGGLAGGLGAGLLGGLAGGLGSGLLGNPGVVISFLGVTPRRTASTDPLPYLPSASFKKVSKLLPGLLRS